jgi:hypothetical protein
VSVPRFLADADVRRATVRGVLQLAPAAEFVSVRSLGMAAAHDRDILEYAAANQWIVVSHDVHTMSKYASERIAAGKLMRGLILIPQRRVSSMVTLNLFEIWAAMDAEEWVDRIEFLPL